MKPTSKNLFKNVDLNDEKTQQKMMERFMNGLPCSDSNGHFEKIQFKIAGYAMGPLEKIRQTCPKGYFKSDSDLHRRVYAVGAFVAMKIVEQSLATEKEFLEEFEELEKASEISKALRKIELKSSHNRLVKDVEDAFKSSDISIEELVQALLPRLNLLTLVRDKDKK